MNVVLWIVFGAIVGFLVDLVSGQDSGCLGSIITGIIGSFVGGTALTYFRTGTFNITAAAGFDLESIVVSVVGAVIFLAVVNIIRGK